MSKEHVIDGMAFARAGRVIEGRIPLADLGRLADSVVDERGELVYVLRGAIDERGRAVLSLTVDGELPMICQRCLGAYPYPLGARARLVLVEDAALLPDPADEPPDEEWMLAEPAMDVVDLVEQEALLCVPYAPIHEGCEAKADADPAARPDDRRQEAAFGALAALKSRR